MDPRRKQKIYAELRLCEAEIDQAEEKSMTWERRNQILELAERLPEDEELAWKAKHRVKLRRAARLPAQIDRAVLNREGSSR